MEIDDLLKAVREALAEATPGPWEADLHPVRRRSPQTGRLLKHRSEDGTVGAVSVVDNDGVYGVMAGADAHLIAHAPEWLAKLCDEVERLNVLLAPLIREYPRECNKRAAAELERDVFRTRLDAADKVCDAVHKYLYGPSEGSAVARINALIYALDRRNRTNNLPGTH